MSKIPYFHVYLLTAFQIADDFHLFQLQETKVCLMSLTVNRRGWMYSRPIEATPKRRPSLRNEQYLTLLGYSDLSFSVLFLICKANAEVYMKRGMAHLHPIVEAFSLSDTPPPQVSQRPSAKASPILGSTVKYPPTQRAIASWDHLPLEANPSVLTCQGLQLRHPSC
jgi:hypothetical protein